MSETHKKIEGTHQNKGHCLVARSALVVCFSEPILCTNRDVLTYDFHSAIIIWRCLIAHLCGLLVMHDGNSFNIRGQDVSIKVMTQDWLEPGIGASSESHSTSLFHVHGKVMWNDCSASKFIFWGKYTSNGILKEYIGNYLPVSIQALWIYVCFGAVLSILCVFQTCELSFSITTQPYQYKVPQNYSTSNNVLYVTCKSGIIIAVLVSHSFQQWTTTTNTELGTILGTVWL